MGMIPQSFQTSDDLGMRSLVDASYSGEYEWNTIFNPIFGLLLRFGYLLIPSFDWYVFALVALQLTAIKFLVTDLIRNRELPFKILVVTFCIFAFSKFLFPMQFTAAAILLSTAGCIRISVMDRGVKGISWMPPVTLLLLGIAIRPEAALLAAASVVVPLGIANYESQRESGPLRYWRLAGISLAGTLLFIAHAWMIDSLPTSPTVITFQSRDESESTIPVDSNADESESLGTATAIELLEITGGFFIDSTSDGRLQNRTFKEAAESLSWEARVQRSAGEFFSRTYLVFALFYLVLVALTVIRGLRQMKRLLPQLLSFSILVGVVMPFIVATYSRLPYRLVMPLWVAQIMVALLVTGWSSVQQLQVESSANDSRWRTVLRANSSKPLLSLLAATLVLMSSLSLGGLSVRYAVFYLKFFHRQEAISIQKTELAACLTENHPVAFAVVPETWVPGGGLTPIDSQTILQYPILDSGWLLHSSYFRDRVARLGLTESDSVIELLIANQAAVLASPETISLMAALHNERNPSDPVIAQLILGCKADAWRLEPQT